MIAITLGDPGGIGPEVTAKALKKIRFRSTEFLLIGIPKAFVKKKSTYRFLDISSETNAVIASPAGAKQSWRLLRPCGARNDGLKCPFEKGKISRLNGAVALASIQKASDLALAGKVAAIVTAPVNKTAMRLVDPTFVGHTEFFARRAKVRAFAMMFVSKKLKVTLATIHVPIRRVSRLIRTPLVYEKIRLTHEFLKKYMGIKKPKIAVCALNPHGHETGPEDDRFILPAVQKARRSGILAEGPKSADQLFFDAYEGRFDAVVSMYHDQGLAPFKMIAFRDGVNVTLGLPYIRTSPDHGTAFDIAYQNKADERSMVRAIELAIRLTQTKKVSLRAPKGRSNLVFQSRLLRRPAASSQ